MKTPNSMRMAASLLIAVSRLTSPSYAGPTETVVETKLDMPSVFEDFVNASNAQNTESVTGCFSKDSVVYDEGQIMRGSADIHAWIAGGFKKYQYVVTPTQVKEVDKGVVVTAVVVGNFPGSRVSLDFHCKILCDKIDVMVVQPTPVAK